MLEKLIINSELNYFRCIYRENVMPEISRFYGIIIYIDLHKDELMANWMRLTNYESPERIEPLA